METITKLSTAEQTAATTIVETLRAEFEQITNFATGKKKLSKIVKIILFGSRATGKAVSNRITGYLSDYDILIIINRRELINHNLWHTAEERLRAKIPMQVNFIVHTSAEVNNALKKGHYFFKDIRKSGVVLYESSTKPLAQPGDLSATEYQAIARDHFTQWYPSACTFLDVFEYCLGKQQYNNAAFQLHQATERFYACLLLVLTNYKPHTHDLKHLNALCIQQDRRVAKIFPQAKKIDRRAFQLLKKAYIEARYSHAYKITGEELTWLSERVELLRDLVKTISAEKMTKG